MEWYTKAADQGNSNAQYNIGIMHYNGNGVPRDYTAAREWFLKSANQGNSISQFFLGMNAKSLQFFFSVQLIVTTRVDVFTWGRSYTR